MSKARDVFFFGDDNLQGAASYLGGVMAWAGINFFYCPSDKAVPHDKLKSPNSLFIVSDYPARNLSPGNQETLARSVGNGASLLMIGGWESFHGLEGEYHEGPVADLLPVKCKDSDDRVNWCQGVVPKVVSEHASIKELPLDKPPVFCGFNETGLREGAEPVLSACLLEIRGGSLAYTGREYPLLVFGKSGKGTTCALTTDLAPHWVGGWVDWGPERVAAQARGGETVEVGNWYAKFITQLVSFLREA